MAKVELTKLWYQNQRVILITAVALLLTIFLLAVRAGAPFVAFEAESATTSGNAVTKSATNASGGQYVEFTAGTTPPPTTDCSGVSIVPGDNWQNKVNANSSTTTFCIKAGMHRAQSVSPKSGNTFIGEPGAIFNGTRIVSDWTKSGNYWVSNQHTQSFTLPGTTNPCEHNLAACEVEDLFKNNQPLVRVLSLSELSSGEFYFDEANDRMYIAEDPAGKLFEATVIDEGFDPNGATNVTVKNLIIEKFGVNGISMKSGWVVDGVEVRYVHGRSIRLGGTNLVLRNSYIHHGGQYGIAGNGTDILIENNELAYNNYLYYGTLGGVSNAGAVKLHQSTNAIFRGNYSHHNTGDGLWYDWDNIDSLIENNRFEGNTRFGIFYEASFKGVIRNNLIKSSGGSIWKFSGNGLFINTSKDLEVYGNTFEGNPDAAVGLGFSDRGTSEYGLREIRNFYFHDNIVRVPNGAKAVNLEFGVDKISDSQYNNRFEDNTYYVPNTGGSYWDWDKSTRTWNSWNSIGHDEGGTLNSL